MTTICFPTAVFYLHTLITYIGFPHKKQSSYCILSTIWKEYRIGYPVFLYIITHLRYNTISYL